ncbi:MAG: glutathione S-transferase [Hyphomicrobiales bacterium]|nr:glutathione S-transferase [Hyphomicrobiales bacterium]
MKLRFSPASPFARKCAIAGHVLGLADRIELVDGAGDPGDAIRSRNPLIKIPLLFTDDGEAIFDSVVISEYLDHLAGGGRIIPTEGKARFRALTMQALADGVMEAAILIMYEGRFREPTQHSPRWIAMQQKKADTGLDALEAQTPGAAIDVGTIAVAAMLGYLDFRFKGEWRASRPKLAAWFDAFAKSLPGYQATHPGD